ncbi:hypothetical protein SDC9_41040 [bioreactor metagenome]|uniref:Uncharacterized protein n=1 Tax=bioreactor metagenome TaxID=1076179 RepID=A0A644VU03_9ZZZZ
MPADLQLLARVQAGLAERVARLHHEVVDPGDPHPGAEDVAHVDHLEHLGVDHVRARRHHLGLELDALGADRDQCVLADMADVDGRRADQLAGLQPNRAGFLIEALDGAGQLVVLADELGDEAVLRPLVKLVRRGKLLDPAVVEHRDAVRHGQCLALIVGDIDHGDAKPFVQRLDLELHVLAQLLVEGAERFVHQHQLGVEDQGPGERDALLLAARHLCGATVGELAHLHHVEGARHFRLALGFGHAPHLERKGQVLGHRHMREKRVVLEHHADPALVRRKMVDVRPAEAYFAVRGGFESRQHHQAGCLARAGRAEHGQEFAFADREVEVLHHQSFAVVALLDVIEYDETFVGRCSRQIGLPCRFFGSFAPVGEA